MAYTFTTSAGSTLIIPDSSIDVVVANNPAGIVTSGVIALVGEADEGPSWSQDAAAGSKLSDNSFGPADINRVIAKYGSGRLVDAYRGIVAPSASPRIQGSPNRVILVKSNNSSKASLTTPDSHGTFTAKRGGKAGNQIQESISTSTSESAPSTNSFSYVPNAASSSFSLRVNGEASQTYSLAANYSPASLASDLTSSGQGVNAVGGVNRNITQGLSGSNNVELSVVSGQDVQIKLTSPDVWGVSPQVGDTVRIPSGSVIQGGSNENVGWYLVTAVSNTTASAMISATKITAGAPAAVSPVAFSGTPGNDIVDYSFMRIDVLKGSDRNILAGKVGTNLTLSASGSSLTVTMAVSSVFANRPQVGDNLYIPSGSAFAGAGSANVGWYSVTGVSNTTSDAHLNLSRLSNGSPVSVAATAIAAVTDLQCNDKQIKGVGKALELKSGTLTSSILLDLGVNSPLDAIDTLMVSSAELKKTVIVKRTTTAQEETYSNLGGNVVLSIGYAGTTASGQILDISGVTHLQTTVSGGSGSNLDIDLSQFASINDLVSHINMQTGYSAQVSNALDGQRNPSILDKCSFSLASGLNQLPGRIKRDIYDLTRASASLASSSLVSYSPIATAGLPEDASFSFLSGGAKGASSGLQMSQAVDALQAVRCNFVVPLVSQDASDDAAEGETESGSTYTVDAINVAVRAHCLAMSTAKLKRHRIGLVSKRGSFQDAKTSALNMSSFRIAHLFQDVLDLNSNGDIEQFQPWMAAVKAAGMQAAGAYKSIFNKSVAISGAKQAAGDFDDENLSQCEDAILSGLIPIQKQETGGFNFLTDQMTYGLDNNVVYNSLQAVYISDLMALSLADSLKKAFVGESVADVTTAVAESFVKAKMAEFLGLKFTVGTKDAPGGWKSIAIRINGSVMEVDVTAVLATTIKFIPITLTIEGIKSSSAA